MSTLGQFRFSFVFLGLPKLALIAIGAYLRLLLVASLLIIGYRISSLVQCQFNVNVEFKVTLHEVCYRGTLQQWLK